MSKTDPGRFFEDFRLGDTLEHGDGLFLHPGREFAFGNQLFDFRKVAAVIVLEVFLFGIDIVNAIGVMLEIQIRRWRRLVMMGMFVAVAVTVWVAMIMVRVVVTVAVIVVVPMSQMHIELYPFDGSLVLTGNVQVIAVQFQFAQRLRERVGIRAEVNQGADKHVTADAAKNIEIECFH